MNLIFIESVSSQFHWKIVLKIEFAINDVINTKFTTTWKSTIIVQLFFVMIRTSGLILLFVTYAFGIREFCVYEHHCGPEERCGVASRGLPMKQCVGREFPTGIPRQGQKCKRNRDCWWYLGHFCMFGRCTSLPIG